MVPNVNLSLVVRCHATHAPHASTHHTTISAPSLTTCSWSNLGMMGIACKCCCAGNEWPRVLIISQRPLS